MPFAEIVGHARPLETLKWSLEKDRLHHAYLFLGPEGVGKRTTALSLAMALHCREKSFDFCGSCDDCVRIRKGNHPDVRLVEPLAGKKEITIQQVRELERGLNFRSFSGGKRVAILDPATLLNLSAQNALLKTLEEPPSNSLIILIATSAGGLLPTLLSRCLRLSFAPLPRQALAEFLVSRRGMGRERAGLLAAVAMGSLGRAIGPGMDDFLARRKAWSEKLSSLTPGDARGWIALAEELASEREESLEFLQWMEGWYRDMMIYRCSGELREISNLDMAEEIKGQAERYDLRRILDLRSEAVQTSRRIARNFNRRMALEDFLKRAAG